MKNYEDSILLKKSKDEFYNEHPIDTDALHDLLDELTRSARVYFHGVGYNLEFEGDRVCQIHYSLPGIEARRLYETLRVMEIKTGMSCRNSYDTLEAKYQRSEMGPYRVEDY